MNTIKWKEVPGYEDRYLCSEYGDIFSIWSNRNISSRVKKNGYVHVNLWRKQQQRTTCVHAVVAETFIGPREELMQVNHKDGNKLNNHISNLEYVTAIGNARHAIRIGLVDNYGENNPRSKLKNKDVLKICKMLKSGKMTHKQIADIYGVTSTAISYINNGKAWGTITKIARSGNKKRCLSSDEVVEICKMLVANNKSAKEIASIFNISKHTIYEMWAGKTHRKITKSILPSYNKQKQLSKEEVIEIRELIEDRLSDSEIAAMYNMHKITIYRIRTGQTWQNV